MLCLAQLMAPARTILFVANASNDAFIILNQQPIAGWHSQRFDSVTAALDEIAASASPSVREELLAAFRQSTRFEWMFWDSAHRREAWPI